MWKISSLVVWLLLFSMSQVMAQAIEPNEKTELLALLSAMSGGKAPDSLRESPVPGLYEVMFDSDLFYISANGRYVLTGNMVDLKTQANLSEPRIDEARGNALAKIRVDSMLVYSPEKPAKHTVTIFTDIDCGYCRKLHAGMKQMNDLGIEVRYLFFPRSGVGSDSYKKAVSVWCAKDQKKALTDAKLGKDFPQAVCDTPIPQHMKLVKTFGLRGTPAIVTEKGKLLPGYVPPSRLAKLLDEESKVVVSEVN